MRLKAYPPGVFSASCSERRYGPPDHSPLGAVPVGGGTSRERDLQQIRETGWAQPQGEGVPDAFGVAAPFFTDEAVAGSLTFTIPRFRIDSVDVPALTTMLTLAARQITGLLSI